MDLKLLAPGFVLTAILASSAFAQEAQVGDLRTKAPHRHGPASIRRLHDDGTAESYNWGGYAVAAATTPATPTTPTGVSATYVSGSWVVPTATCSNSKRSSTQYASFWVGIDGWYSNTVEQIGTDSDCSSGKPSYYAWYEFYPLDSYNACPPATGGKHSKPPPCPLNNLTPGDVITASVQYHANGTFTATITDESMNPPASFTTTFTPNASTGTPQLSSAEWITESPCCTNNGGFLPLTDFGTICYGQDFTSGAEICAGVKAPGISTVGANDATINNVGPAPIGSFGVGSPQVVWQTTIVNQNYTIPSAPQPACTAPAGDVMACPSSLSTDGSSFTVHWQNIGP